MKRALASIVALLAPAAIAAPIPAPATLTEPAPHVGFAGGDGSSCKAAVVITGAKREVEGIRAQRWWVFSKNPGAMIDNQEMSSQGGKDLETITLIMKDGTRKTVCFDITTFYGKP